MVKGKKQLTHEFHEQMSAHTYVCVHVWGHAHNILYILHILHILYNINTLYVCIFYKLKRKLRTIPLSDSLSEGRLPCR